MRSAIWFTLTVLCSLHVHGQSARDFLGEWINTDVQGLPRIVIREEHGTWKIRAWGRCDPEPCDWGEVTFDPVADSAGSRECRRGLARWEMDFADTLLLIKFEGTGADYYTRKIKGKDLPCRADVPQIMVEAITLFKDGSDRSNCRHVSLLHKKHVEKQ